MSETVQYFRWQDPDRPTETTGDENTVRSMIELGYSIVSPSHPTWVIDNDLMQAAMEIAKRVAAGKLIADWKGREYADKHHYRHPGRIRVMIATNATDVHELADAIRRNPQAQQVIADRALKLGGVGIAGNDLNLVLVAVAAEGDPLGTRQDQELLEQVPLRDGLQYGDPELLKSGAVKPAPIVEVW